jgi:predicted nucleic acid-binding protein
MIVLDTNVLSELLRAEPEPAVFDWTASQPLETLFTTTVTQSTSRIAVSKCSIRGTLRCRS